MKNNSEDIEVLKWMLEQYYWMQKRRKTLEKRLSRIQEEHKRPVGGSGHNPMPRNRKGMRGDSEEVSLMVIMSDIEEDIYDQIENADKALARVMSILEYLPEDGLERDICEKRHIDGMTWKQVEDSIPMTHSACWKKYKKALAILLESDRNMKLVKENARSYYSWRDKKKDTRGYGPRQ